MLIRFSIGDVLSRSFSILGKNFVAFFLITALVQAPALALQLYMEIADVDPAQGRSGILQLTGALVIATLLLAPLSTATVTYGVLQQLRGRHASVGDCFQAGFSRALPVLGVAIAAGLLYVLGALACLIPGLIFMTAYYVAAPAAVVERLGVHASLSRSWQLTDGVRWSVFGLIFLVGVMNAAINFAFDLPTSELEGTAGIIAATLKILLGAVERSFTAVMCAVAYHDLRTEKEGVNSQDLARVFD